MFTQQVRSLSSNCGRSAFSVVIFILICLEAPVCNTIDPKLFSET